MSKNFRLEWGSPAKPNIWRARELTFGQPLKIVEVLSEVMVGALEISATDVRYFRSASSWADGSTVLAQIGEVDRERFESAYFYNKYIKPHIESGKIKIREGFKVASSELTVGELIQARPESISLPWGSPPKPNIWKTNRVSYWGDRVRYIVESPAIAKHNVLKNYNREILSFEIEIVHESTGFVDGVVYIRSMGGIVDKFVVARVRPDFKLTPFLKIAWENISESSMRGNYFTEGMKIASSSTHIDDLFELSGGYLGKNFRLDWGDPAKPNLWKFTLKGQDRKNKILDFEIRSPLIKENPKVINGKLYNLEDKLYVKVVRTHLFYGVRVTNALQTEVILDNIPVGANPSSSIEGLMRVFWERFGLNIKRDLLKSGMKVASNHSSFSSQLSVTGKTFRLDWGDPPKPNLWRFTLQGSERDSLGGERYGFYIESPLIKEGRLLFTITKINSMQYELRLHGSSMSGEIKNYYHGDNKNIEHVMRGFWEREKKKIKAYFLKPSMKVASSVSGSMSFLEFLYTKQVNAEISLPWGSPPKPNLWKAKVSDKTIQGVDVYKEIHISSPVLKEDLVYFFVVSDYNNKTYVVFKLFSKDSNKIIHSYTHPLADYKRYTLYDVLKNTYEYIIAPTRKENILKEGLKVASKKGSSNVI